MGSGLWLSFFGTPHKQIPRTARHPTRTRMGDAAGKAKRHGPICSVLCATEYWPILAGKGELRPWGSRSWVVAMPCCLSVLLLGVLLLEYFATWTATGVCGMLYILFPVFSMHPVPGSIAGKAKLLSHRPGHGSPPHLAI